MHWRKIGVRKLVVLMICLGGYLRRVTLFCGWQFGLWIVAPLIVAGAVCVTAEQEGKDDAKKVEAGREVIVDDPKVVGLVKCVTQLRDKVREIDNHRLRFISGGFDTPQIDSQQGKQGWTKAEGNNWVFRHDITFRDYGIKFSQPPTVFVSLTRLDMHLNKYGNGEISRWSVGVAGKPTEVGCTIEIRSWHENQGIDFASVTFLAFGEGE